MSSMTNLESSMFHGLTSEILDFTSVRGSVVGNLMHHLTFFGAALGRYPHVEWRGTKYADINCILVGTTSCGKGESLDIINELYTFPEEHQELLAPARRTMLTSGKRTIHMIHALLGDGGEETRFLSIDEECSAQIKSAAHGNNTLAQTLIKLIDGSEIAEPYYSRTIEIPPLHFGSIGHITPMVLIRAMGRETFFNGLGNRFLFMSVPDTELSLDDGRYSDEDMCAIRQKLIESLSEGGARTSVPMDAGARELYVSQVLPLRQETGSPEVSALQKRLPDMCLKLALTLALVNREESITRKTMEEACAIIDYSRKTLGELFGATEEETPEQIVLNYLEEHGRTRRTPLMDELSKRLSRQLVDATLTSLVNQHRVTRTTQIIARGRRPEFFELTPAVQLA